MDNSDFWNNPNGCSLAGPGDGFDLFGDPAFGLDWSLFGDADMDFALNDAPLPVLDYCSTSQEHRSSSVSSSMAAMLETTTLHVLASPPSSNDRHGSLLGQTCDDDSLSVTFVPKIPNHESSSSANAEKESTKRKIADSVFVFSLASNNEVKSRKRRAFSSSRKGEVALNRLIGACIQCKIKKNAVSGLQDWAKGMHILIRAVQCRSAL